MKKLLFTLALLLPYFSICQTVDQNYILNTEYKEETSTVQNPRTKETILYYDGLGRPIQKIDRKHSGTSTNIITHMEYDEHGRQVKEYLPYVNNHTGLTFETGAQDETINYAPYLNDNPITEKILQVSPLDYPLTTSSPGADWAMGQDHEVRYSYDTNSASEVRLFSATSSWNATSKIYDISLSQTLSTYYPANELFKTVVKDENWATGDGGLHTTTEFKNKEGKLVLKKTFAEYTFGQSTYPLAHETYYVYDQFGNLTYVIPPLANISITLSSTAIDGLCYQYKYDYRNRVAAKKLPGKAWEYMVYDQLDRPVAIGPTLDPFGSGALGWTINKYDKFNRIVYTGWMLYTTTDTGRKQLQDSFDSLSDLNEKKLTGSDTNTISNIPIKYTSGVALPATLSLLTVNYYDDYNFPNMPTTIPTSVLSNQSQLVAYNNSHKPTGLPTGNLARVLTANNTTDVNWTYILYDKKDRPIRNYTHYFDGGYNIVDSAIDFSGNVLFKETTQKLTAGTDEIFIAEEFKYTDEDRLSTHTHQLNGGDVQTLKECFYDELGKLIQKNMGSNSLGSLQKVDFKYNIKGWLTDINDVDDLAMDSDLFSFHINYNQSTTAVSQADVIPLYNGNIAETVWRSANDNVYRRYGYEYDATNRLLRAVYQKPYSSLEETNSYDEYLTYDKNGNILTLFRSGEYDDPNNFYTIDQLSYTYRTDNPNQLAKVNDGTNSSHGFKNDNPVDTVDDYSYDSLGNMLTDENKKITSIKYNHLNQPAKITFDAPDTREINYLYDALGNKLKKTSIDYTDEVKVNYRDGIQYNNETVDFITTDEGYISNTPDENGDHFYYAYNYLDHLGNIRLTFGFDKVEDVVKIMEEHNYYPFGLRHENYNFDAKLYSTIGQIDISNLPRGYQYKYQGQERQEELGLNWDSFKYRNYDYAIGRFMSVDPLAEKYPYNSIYAFQENKMGIGREIEGLELGGASFNKYAAEFGKAVTSFIDSFGIQTSNSVTNIVTLGGNTTLENTQENKSGYMNLTNYCNSCQYPNFGDSNLFEKGSSENKTEIKSTVKGTAHIEVIDITASNVTSTNVKTGKTENVSKGVVGAGESGVYVSSTKNNSGETKNRAGVQAQVTIPTGSNTKLRLNASVSVGNK
jgi:RHS repeat-associated protein